ncbi:hypothetical protein [Frondihabitans sp. VKM Ac-2883]|uniref:hypothetical protein n=1 Tax=Frondihabitans sp. VKM Ac-2883 TaxID=2783823 RepID=UPI00188C3CD5|nr:hypothetical protein [Frondihabitans sp. VKM Ac-2883]MBF4577011.1 hypothetical protein [Frondihabitans sp. VKM Ac-2883]
MTPWWCALYLTGFAVVSLTPLLRARREPGRWKWNWGIDKGQPRLERWIDTAANAAMFFSVIMVQLQIEFSPLLSGAVVGLSVIVPGLLSTAIHNIAVTRRERGARALTVD